MNDDHGVIINGPNGNRHKSSSVSKCTRMCLIYYMTVTDIQPRSPGDLLSTGQRIKSTIQSWWEIFSSPSVRHNNMQILTQNTLVLRSRDKSNKIVLYLCPLPADHSLTPEPHPNMARPNHLDLLTQPLNNINLRKMSSVSTAFHPQ